ncbi:hypothetical protein VaNZ11_016411 [Volvox africanus]|uniref:DUF4042 domain-containing protein n=1 Tax=Volvox africanus TaxID=51714 RepID=A0ABQ5SMR5_9CHLO|nr:hypothetical protein VaNZ11_016411 [Volvox africanus]
MTDLTSLCTLLVSVGRLRCGIASCQGIENFRTDVCNPKDSYSGFSTKDTQIEVSGAVSCPGMQAAGAGPPVGISVWPVWQSRPAPMSMKTRSGETHAAALWTDDMDETSILHLLTAAQNHGAQGSSAALYIAALSAAAVDALRSSSNNFRQNLVHGAAVALRRAAVWLAEISTNASVPEPAARAAMTGLAEMLTAALQALRMEPSAVAATTVTTTAVGGEAAAPLSGVGELGFKDVATSMPKEMVTATAAAAAAMLYEPRCDAVRLTAAAVSALYGRCPDAAAVAAAARLLGCCLQLQLQLPPPLRSTAVTALPPPPLSFSAQPNGWMAAAGRLGIAGRDGTALNEPPAVRPVGLSEAAGWGALLELRRHPHPLVRTACLSAVQQACTPAAAAAAAPSVGDATALPPLPPPPPHLLDSGAAVAAYAAAAGCMDDDAEETRAAAAALVSTLAVLVPELSYGTHFGVAARLVDDAFMRLCALVADSQRGLRLQALRALGGLHAASLRVKLQALSKKTTLRVAAPPPIAPPPPSAGTAAIGAANVSGGDGGGGGVKAWGKRPAVDESSAAAAAAVGAPLGAKNAMGGGSSSSKRLTTAAWETQSWLTAATPRSGSRSGSGPLPGSGSGSTSGPPGSAGGADGGTVAVAFDDLTLLENAVGAFVLGSEDEHWEVRVATLDAMTRLAEYEYRTAAAAALATAAATAAAAAAAAAVDPVTNATAAAAVADTAAAVLPPAAAGSAVEAAARLAIAAGTGGGGRGGSGGTADSLSVRIGGIGGSPLAAVMWRPPLPLLKHSLTHCWTNFQKYGRRRRAVSAAS